MKKIITASCITLFSLSTDAQISGDSVAAGLPASAPSGYHVFKDAQGRTLIAKILEFNEQNGRVKLFLENETSRTVPTSVFSVDDQDYIRRWFKAQDLLSKRFIVSVSQDVKEQQKDTYYTDITTGERHKFQVTTFREISKRITIGNNTQQDFGKILCEWCIHYDQEKLVDNGDGSNGRPREETFKLYSTGQEVMQALSPGESYTVLADPFMVFHTRLAQKMNNPAGWMQQRSIVHGIWVKLSIPLGDGNSVVREYCEPEGIRKFGWKR